MTGPSWRTAYLCVLLLVASGCPLQLEGARCDEDGQCPDSQVCRGGRCVERARADGGSLGGDAGAGGCDAGFQLGDAGACEPNHPLGTACVTDDECASGYCVQSVCCDAPCNGLCAACGADGVCRPVARGEDPLDQCEGPLDCNGDGGCLQRIGEPCDAGTADGCQSGHCSDGVCCDTACEGPCRACVRAQTGSVTGNCDAVIANTDPANECEGETTCSGLSTCFKKDGDACVTDQVCQGGVCDQLRCRTPRPPDAPTNVLGTPADASVVLGWTAPASAGSSAIIDYVVQYSSGQSGWITFDDGVSPALSATVTGLVNGTAYAFQVAALNADGAGDYSTRSPDVVPFTKPAAPSGVSAASNQNASSVVTWTAVPAGSNGGDAVIDYTATASPGNATCTAAGASATTCTLTGLSNGTSYTVTVKARNVAGEGPASVSASFKPSTTPAAPSGVSAASNQNASSVVTWTAVPAGSNGGDAVIDYTATASPGNATCTAAGASATTCTLTGLSNGTAYTVTVKARNLSGYGPASSPAVSFTPAGGTSASVPLAPGKPSSTARGNGTVTLTWLPPSSNGGSPVTDYRLEYSTTGSSNWAGLTQAASTATTRTVNGLTNGTAYYFRVAAVNAVGTGTFSVASDAITPIAVPGQPTNVTTQPGSTLVGLSWSAPTDTGDSAITDYIIQYSTDLSAWTTFPDGTSTALDATVTGLANGTSYAFRVAAVNASGTGPYSANASGKPVSVPEAPSGVVGVAGSGEVSLSWTAPSGNGGSPITDYVVQYSTDGASWTPFDDGPSTLTSARVTGLVNGTAYAFQVAAVNAVGTSVYSTSSSFVTPVSALLAPSAPTLANGTAGELGVSWTAPGDSGGSAITGYTATAEASGQSSQTCSTSGATSCTLTGLVNGVGYSVTVTVTNAAGASATSAPSSAVVDQLPGAPTLTHGNQTNSLGQAELTFTAAAAPGTPVTDHVFQFSMTSDFASTQTFNPATTNLQLTQVVTGLSTDPNGQDYWFKVAASNSFGTGQWSVAYGPIKVSAPSLPRNVSASGYDQNSANLWWDPPEFTGGRTVTRYGIQYSSTGGVGWANADPGSHTEAPTATAPLSGVKRSFGLFPNQQGGIRFKVQAVWSVSSEERIGNFTSVFHCDNSSNTAPHDANDECQLDTGTSAPNGSLQLKN